MNISDFLFFDHFGHIANPTCHLRFTPTLKGKQLYADSKGHMFSRIYQLLESVLGCHFNLFCEDYGHLDLKSGVDLAVFEPPSEALFTVMVYMDCDVYWCDVDAVCIEKVRLPRSLLVSFSSRRMGTGGSYPTCSITFEHNFFSNHICTSETFGTRAMELFYFEPAAVLNRMKMRLLSFEILNSLQELDVSFSPDRTRIQPYDKYGFLDGAEIVLE